MKLKKPSYKRNYLSYDLMLDLTTCLHRLVRRIESREALYLAGFFRQISIDLAPHELAATEKQVACVAASSVSAVENQHNLSGIAVRKRAVWHVCVAKIGEGFPRN